MRTAKLFLLLTAIALIFWQANLKSNAQTDFKATLEQINALRTEPEKAGELLEKFVAEAYPIESEREETLKEKYGEKTRRQHLDEAIKFIEAQPKSAALQWDADLATVAANQGKSNNKLFTTAHNFDPFSVDAKKMFLESLLNGVDFQYQGVFNPNLRYIGISVKGDKGYLTFAALKGKAYLLKETEFANRPYDAREDNVAPWGDALSVKQPNITSFVKADGTLDVVWRDMGVPPRAFLTRFSASGAKVFTKEISGVNPAAHPLLAGFTEDNEGNIYVLRATDEGDHDKKNQPDPPKNDKGESDPNWDRPDLMKLTKLDKDGNQIWTKNLAKKGGGAFGFVSPMSPNRAAEEAGRIAGHDTHSSTSRIGFIVHKGTPIIFALYGGATEWDSAISGRHQNAYWRAVDARTGEPVENLNGSAMAHSFDSQLLVSDEGIITAERSDSGLLMGNYLNTRKNPLIFHFFFGTTTDGNECFTQLGSLTKASDGYLVAFVSNNAETPIGKSVSGKASTAEMLRNRNLGVIRIKKGFAQEIDALAEKEEDKKTLDDVLNSMKRSEFRDGLNLIGRTYLTNYSRDDSYSASRPKMVRLADGNYIVIWERWTHKLNKEGNGLEGAFDSVWAMKINQDGEVLKEAVQLSDSIRITRGDEPVLWNGKAAFLAGDVVENKMMIHTVDGNLKLNSMALPLQ